MRQAERTFLERLRRAMRDPRWDCVWWPQWKLYGPRMSAGILIGWQPTGERGSWVIVKWLDVPVAFGVGDVAIITTRRAPVPVFPLDGRYDNPLTPGDWAIVALQAAETDPVSRLSELAEMRQDARRSYIKTVAADEEARMADSLDLLRRGVHQIVAQTGVEVTLKEERIADQRALETRMDELHEREEEDVGEAAYG